MNRRGFQIRMQVGDLDQVVYDSRASEWLAYRIIYEYDKVNPNGLDRRHPGEAGKLWWR